MAFDILGGDFNLDNMCPMDKDEWTHPVFTKYVDVCRKQPGEDHQFTVGMDVSCLTDFIVILYLSYTILFPITLKDNLSQLFKLQYVSLLHIVSPSCKHTKIYITIY